MERKTLVNILLRVTSKIEPQLAGYSRRTYDSAIGNDDVIRIICDRFDIGEWQFIRRAVPNST